MRGKPRTMSVADALDFVRLQRGLTMAEVGRRTGISRTSLSLLLNGHTQPRYATVMAIRKALGITAAELERLTGRAG